MPENNSSAINLLICRRVNFYKTNYSFQGKRVLQTVFKVSLISSQWNCFLSGFPESIKLHVNDTRFMAIYQTFVPFGFPPPRNMDHYGSLHTVFQWSMFLRESSLFATLVRIFFEILSHSGVEFLRLFPKLLCEQ